MDTEDAERLLEGLDDTQRLAVTSDAAPLLVIAGAGSGKTRVLTHRIAWRAAVGTIDPTYALALTFTRKAAGELRNRLAGLGLPSALTAGTFHAVALAQLRRRALDQGKRPPVLLESKLRLLDATPGRGTGSASQLGERADQLGLVALEIEWAKARLIEPAQYADAARAAHRTVEGFTTSQVAELFERYEFTKDKRGVVDFDDLLIDLATELRNDEEFAATQRWRFRHLFVDELQDTNRAQLALLDAWLGGRSDLFAVGDQSQAIYGWNGSDPVGVTEFAERYPGATVLRLDANYRSTPQLVAVAASVLPFDTSRVAVAARADGPAPDLVAYADETDEAESIAGAIHQQRNRGRRFSECAVLARTNAQLLVLEAALDRAGIPVATRGATGFLARASVREALRPIATSTQPAHFARWCRELEEPRAPGARHEAYASDPEVTAIALARDANDLHALSELAAEYAELDPLPQGRGFLAFLRSGLGADPAPVAEDAIDVVTFHRAKGLEWPVVYVTGLEDGFVPISRARDSAALEEERRLLYVALSRAEDELYCSWARSRNFSGQQVARTPSPYIDAIETARTRLSDRPRTSADAAQRALAESRAALRRNNP